MAYATLTDLKLRLGQNISSTNPGLYDQATSRVPPWTTADDTVGQAALDWSEARVNAKVNVRYEIPVSLSDGQTAAMLLGLVLDLAAYHLYATHPHEGNEVPARIQSAYDDAVETLNQIAEGKCVLPSATLLPGPSVLGTVALAGGDAVVFDEAARSGL